MTIVRVSSQRPPSSVIPVPRHWDPENSTANEHIRQLYNKGWIPASRAGMTPSYWMTTKGRWNDTICCFIIAISYKH
ncbi:WPE palindromic element domain-containing protein [Wolbachia endosymbiont (group B) of Limnophora tigrina]|uniref:WPE palindromic element domain-containing protein n=1 Tax=Wolbachia endosymbiont (group B) of Limnophora tigrina TaxID=3139317 RepID=UPI0035B5079D